MTRRTDWAEYEYATPGAPRGRGTGGHPGGDDGYPDDGYEGHDGHDEYRGAGGYGDAGGAHRGDTGDEPYGPPRT
ncbi:hypothetical protein ACWDZ8_44920 [Streptomyces sp. NPDC003233]